MSNSEGTDKSVEPNTKSSETAEESTFVSSLPPGPDRYLAHVIENALELGRRTAADFVRHFPPAQIMAGLEKKPEIRADILEPTTGTKHKIGIKKSAAAAGEDLQIALDEGETSPQQIVELFQPDDRIRYLDRQKLWAFVVEGDFWRVKPEHARLFARAKQHIAFMLDQALEDKLIDHVNLVAGLSVQKLAESLPRHLLGEIIESALSLGKKRTGFTEQHLLATAGARLLVEDVSLVHVWETVVVPKIAAAHGFVPPEEPSTEPNAPIVTTAEAEKPGAAKPAEKAEPEAAASAAAEGEPKAKPAAKNGKRSRRGTNKGTKAPPMPAKTAKATDAKKAEPEAAAATTEPAAAASATADEAKAPLPGVPGPEQVDASAMTPNELADLKSELIDEIEILEEFGEGGDTVAKPNPLIRR